MIALLVFAITLVLAIMLSSLSSREVVAAIISQLLDYIREHHLKLRQRMILT
jgi:hypothetical protein